jgi:RIO-like serine/threonine protein kinase
MTAEATDLLPVLNQVIDFIESSLVHTDDQESKLAALNEEIAKRRKQEKILLEKVASASAPVFNETEVEKTLDRLENLRVIGRKEHAKLAADLRSKPASALDLLATVSEKLIAAPAEGEGVLKESSVSELDPDGWSQFTEGKRVQLKR